MGRSQDSVGYLAENLVADWLRQQGWEILAQRWHCRVGELDLVARQADRLAFVEVKARSRSNWDGDGLLAITAAKQEKLRLAAQYFLAEFPELADLACRFDVALVNSRPSAERPADSSSVQLLRPVAVGTYQLTLQQYIAAAFD